MEVAQQYVTQAYKRLGDKKLGGGMYDRHVPLHLREKPHECEFCQKRFSEKSKLQKHIEAVHSKEKHHEWEFCQGRFSHKYSLQKHDIHNHAFSPATVHIRSLYQMDCLEVCVGNCLLVNISLENFHAHKVSLIAHLNMGAWAHGHIQWQLSQSTT